MVTVLLSSVPTSDEVDAFAVLVYTNARKAGSCCYTGERWCMRPLVGGDEPLRHTEGTHKRDVDGFI